MTQPPRPVLHVVPDDEPTGRHDLTPLLHPRLRADLIVDDESKAGLVYLRRPESDVGFDIYDIEWHMAKFMDGHRSIEEIAAAMKALGVPATEAQIASVVRDLKNYRFLDESGARADTEFSCIPTPMSDEEVSMLSAARAMRARGRIDSALEYGQAALQINPQNREAKRLEEELSELVSVSQSAGPREVATAKQIPVESTSNHLLLFIAALSLVAIGALVAVLALRRDDTPQAAHTPINSDPVVPVAVVDPAVTGEQESPEESNPSDESDPAAHLTPNAGAPSEATPAAPVAQTVETSITFRGRSVVIKAGARGQFVPALRSGKRVKRGETIGEVVNPAILSKMEKKRHELAELATRAKHDPVYAPFVKKLEAEVSALSKRYVRARVRAPRAGPLSLEASRRQNVAPSDPVARIIDKRLLSAPLRTDPEIKVDALGACLLEGSSGRTFDCTLRRGGPTGWLVVANSPGVPVGVELRVRLNRGPGIGGLTKR